MTFYVENEVDAEFPFDINKIVEDVAAAALNLEKCPYEIELNVLITDNEGIRTFNKEYRDIDKETDVLSFPNVDYEEPAKYSKLEENEADYFNPETGELLLGDIILSADRIQEQANEFGHSLLREFSFLTAHSMLHLLGYDHMVKEEADVMEAKQEEILKTLGITRD